MFYLTRHLVTLGVIALTAAPAVAQIPVDDLRVRQLEGEVTRLQRELDAQARRIQMLEQAARLASPNLPSSSATLRQDDSPSWLVAATWDRVKPGMKVPEVIAVLGRPTSTRRTDDGKLNVLFYAMEIGPDSVLSGIIRLDDSGVIEINRPVLK